MGKGNLIFAVSPDSHFQNPVKKSFEKNGYNVILFDYRKNSLFEKFIFGFSLIFPSLKNTIVNIRNRRLIALIKKHKPDILFVSKGELIDKDTIEKIKKLDVVTINWFPDLFEDVPVMESIFPSYDFVFTHDRDHFSDYQKTINLYYLPYGAPITRRPNFKRRKYNVVFIGSRSSEREEMILSLKEFNPAVWGYKSWEDSKAGRFYKGTELSPDQTLKVLHNTKIAINIHRVPYNYGTTLNVRAFEATASGALLLTDKRRDLSRLFKTTGKNKEVISYNNFEELKKLVGFYLGHEDQRISIAKRGFKRALENYRYDLRIKYILNIINK